ncbi:MAG: penicillin-binding protein 2 [Gammaproteobacteria bacterium]|jgi:penicillin-binding protein 2|nr:penicillin-binding protein 2 [Chromatiales bacterium]MDP6674030.1 penicillin-binding protein 2 [Gammaproteobacteria bacterium]
MLTTNRLKDHWAEQQIFLRRVIACTILMISLIIIVLVRLGQLQIIEYEYFSAQSQGNRIRIQPLAPTRGLIYDRNGTVLAENLSSYQLELTPEQVPDMTETLDRLALFGLIDTENIDSIKALIRQHRRFDSIPIRLRLTDVEVAKFAIERPRFPGVDIHARLARNYPYGTAIAHALGYVSGINAADMQTIDKTDYAGTSLIGKISLERRYEQELHGNVGHEEVLVNARGRIMQGLNAELATPGKDLILTLDIESQLAAHQALAGRRGAVVAIDPKTGEVLVFASEPSFDPNAISIGMSRKEYRALQENPDLPLFNRALQGTYPPGSTIKPIIALAALHYDTIDSEQSLFCGGEYLLPGSSHRYRDWKQGGHGLMNLHTAIEQSCDVYFYQLARELGIDRIESFLKRFGLGGEIGIDIAGEKDGLVPGRDWKRRAFSKREDKIWFPGETVITGIGQGYLLVTPLQLAHATATIANRGQRYQPTLLRGYSDSTSTAVEFKQHIPLDSVGIINDGQWEQIISAMNAVMQGEHGTARAVGADAPFTMAGKSGTAQVFTVAQDQEYDTEEIAERMRDHALFVAFAPLEDPQIAVAVIVENGESGSGTAAPIARIVIDKYLRDLL